MKTIPWWQPEIGNLELKFVEEVFRSNFPNEGVFTGKFEKKLARLLNVKYVIAVPSGTAALFLALKSLNIGHGDEVIVPDVSFIATANAVEMTGAKAILIDVEPGTFNIGVKEIEKAITGKTKAIIPVHVSGKPAQIDKIIALSRKRNIPVIEDAAEAFMSMYKGRYLGTFAKIGCYSLAPTKTITTGQGGFIVTNDEKIFRSIKLLKDHGRFHRGSGGDDIHLSLGYNFKFTDIQGAVGLGQLKNLSRRISRMKRNYILYEKYLKGIKGITLVEFNVKSGECPLWIEAIAENRDDLYNFLTSKKMYCRKFWYPIHTQSYYKQSDKNFPVSSKFCPTLIWLPSAFTVNDSDIKSVCDSIKKFYSQFKK